MSTIGFALRHSFHAVADRAPETGAVMPHNVGKICEIKSKIVRWVAFFMDFTCFDLNKGCFFSRLPII